jgi:hypothetical protein
MIVVSKKGITMYWVTFMVIGLSSGILAGLFGVGGGIFIVPALMYLAGFSQKLAVGTSLAVLLPPIGIAAVLEYYRNGNVDFRAAFIIAAMAIIGGWIGARTVNHIDTHTLKIIFGVFLIIIGSYMIFEK